MISFRQGKSEDSSNDYYVLYKRNRINIEIILNSISKTHIRIWFDQINWAFRTRFEASVVSSRCTFPWPTGGSGSAPRARKRGRKGLRNYNALTRKIHMHTHLPWKSNKSRDSDDVSVRWGQDPLAAPSLTQAAAFTPNNSEKDSLGRSTWSQAQNVSQDSQYPAPDYDDRHTRTCRAATRDCCRRFVFARRDRGRAKSRNATARRKEWRRTNTCTNDATRKWNMEWDRRSKHCGALGRLTVVARTTAEIAERGRYSYGSTGSRLDVLVCVALHFERLKWYYIVAEQIFQGF